MSTPLHLHIDGVMAPEKFELIGEKLGYRVAYQEMDPCPNDMAGCRICDAKGGVTGKHPRPFERVRVEDTLRRSEDGSALILPHRLLTAPLELTLPDGTPLIQNEDYTLSGRRVEFISGRLAPRGEFVMRYEAIAEDWVHLQHAHADFAGAGRKAEYARNLSFANLEQGVIAMSIPASARGYQTKAGDRYLPVDAEMRFSMTVDADRANLVSRHQFVTRVVRAYGLDSRNAQVPLAAEFHPDTRKFSLSGGEYERAVILYDAVPVYTTYLDQGEFRHPMADSYNRLVLLMREEVSR